MENLVLGGVHMVQKKGLRKIRKKTARLYFEKGQGNRSTMKKRGISGGEISCIIGANQGVMEGKRGSRGAGE